MDVYIQGKSIDRRIFANDGNGDTVGSALDTSSFLTAEVEVVHKQSGFHAGTYSLANGKLVRESPTADGYLFFDIPPSVTLTMIPGVYELQFTTTETDANYDSSVRTRGAIGGQFRLDKKIV